MLLFKYRFIVFVVKIVFAKVIQTKRSNFVLTKKFFEILIFCLNNTKVLFYLKSILLYLFFDK